MEVAVCSSCSKQQELGTQQILEICDACKLPISGNKMRCEMCEEATGFDEKEAYHTLCTVKVDGDRFCPTHATKKRELINAAKTIKAYVEKFWRELGGKVSKIDSDGEFEVLLPGLRLKVHMIYLNKIGSQVDLESGSEIAALEYQVKGIKSYGLVYYEMNIHNHTKALLDVACALIRSLRSKKAIIAGLRKKYYKYWDQSGKVANTQELKAITETATSLRDKVKGWRKLK